MEGFKGSDFKQDEAIFAERPQQTLYYAGIGSRQTPLEVQETMTRVANRLEKRGFKLRSGGAQGADKAFEIGVEHDWNKAIYRAHKATPQAIELASRFHPAWHFCENYVRKLHGRNAQIILGPELNDPVQFVVCWTLNEEMGGTSLGLRIARNHKCRLLGEERPIEIYNLAAPDQAYSFFKFLDAIGA